MSDQIIIYSSYNCGYCDLAKKLLDQKQIKILRYENDTVLVSEGLDSSDSVLLTRLAVLIKGMKLKKN